MSEWLYKATEARVSEADTLELASEFGFICRSAYADRDDREQLISNVGRDRGVDLGDVIHMYYVVGSEGVALGAYKVVAHTRHPCPQYFGRPVDETWLREVSHGPLLDALVRLEGYAPDPRLNFYTGWPVVRVNMASPQYDPSWFPGMNTLVRR